MFVISTGALSDYWLYFYSGSMQYIIVVVLPCILSERSEFAYDMILRYHVDIDNIELAENGRFNNC